MERSEKKGYLKEDFRIFYLKDDDMEEMHPHYHDFDKILLFLNGNVSYNVEGRTYSLESYDIVLVGKGEIHRPILHETAGYERIIFYLEPSFLARIQKDQDGLDLRTCFAAAADAGSHVLRIPSVRKNRLGRIVSDLKSELTHPDRYGAALSLPLLLLEFLIELNRQARDPVFYAGAGAEDALIVKLLSYLHAHLTDPLTVDQIAAAFFISPSYLMHTFKRETGYSVGRYLSRKRLLLARDMIRSGASPTEAAFACGFQSYSAFFRAYKKAFGKAPGQP
jgi:AraC-like DNA-binding protein